MDNNNTFDCEEKIFCPLSKTCTGLEGKISSFATNCTLKNSEANEKLLFHRVLEVRKKLTAKGRFDFRAEDLS